MSGYAKLIRAIWQDDDFVALDDSTQRLYFLLISQPDISQCGVLALTPGRWARMAGNTVLYDISQQIDRLTASRFVVVDRSTEELWVRSYMKYDEGHKVPNILKAIVKAIEAVSSKGLRNHLIDAAGTLELTLPETLRRTNAESLYLVTASSTLAPESASQPEHGTTQPPMPAKPAQDDVWNCLARHFGTPSTATEKSNRGRQTKELRAAGASPADIDARVQEHKRRRIDWKLTANALVAHWTELEPVPTVVTTMNGARLSAEAEARM